MRESCICGTIGGLGGSAIGFVLGWVIGDMPLAVVCNYAGFAIGSFLGARMGVGHGK